MSDTPARQKLIKDIQLRLGAGMVDIELDPEHYNYAVDVAIDRYRMRSDNALEESFIFIQLQPEVSTFTLPQEVQEVRDIYRRTMGGGNGAGAQIDPFALAYTNNMYLLSSPGASGGLGGGGAGSLALYDFAAQYQETAGRMFGRDVQFSWNASTKKLLLHRRFTGQEEIALHVYNTKPEEVLFADPYAKVWLRDYAIAQSKLILGEARGKFTGGLAGPQGGISLNGAELKQEALEEINRLEEELKNQIDSHGGYGFIIG